MKNKTRLFAAVLFSGALLAARAGAAVGSFTDPTQYAAATTATTSYAFSGAPAGAAPDRQGVSFTNGPVTFSDTNLNYTGSPINLYNDNAYGGGVNYLSDSFGDGITLTLSSTATAVSFDLGTYNGAQGIAITLNGDAVFVLNETGGQPTTGFVGFTDTVPITSLTFTNTAGATAEIDVIDFTVGNAVGGAVPEPSTWTAMLGGVFFLLGAALKPRLSKGH